MEGEWSDGGGGGGGGRGGREGGWLIFYALCFFNNYGRGLAYILCLVLL